MAVGGEYVLVAVSYTHLGLQNYDDLYADVLLWAREGSIAYNIPQIYWEIGHKAADYEPMLQRMYKGLDQNVFTTNRQSEPIVSIEDLEAYNEKEGLALSKEEMDYLKKVENDLGRKLTDSRCV